MPVSRNLLQELHFELDNGRFHLHRVTDRVRCGCGHVLAVLNDGALLFRTSPVLVDSSAVGDEGNEIFLRCPKCRTYHCVNARTRIQKILF